MLTPKSGIGAGLLHRVSVALAKRGPWSFSGVVWGDAVDGPADGEPTRPEHIVRGGTCEVCSAAIINIVTLRNSTGQRITVGIDCAETLLDNQAKLHLKKAIAPHEKAKRTAAKARRIARVAGENLVKHGQALILLDALAKLPVNRETGYAQQFGRDVARSLRSGSVRELSERQIACAAKLATAHLAA
jgi:hypothetical protein